MTELPPAADAQRPVRGTSARAGISLGLIIALTLAGQRAARAADEESAKAAPPAAAAAPKPGTEPQREKAKAKYQQGVEAYRAERYADAVRLFLEADAISPSAVLSYNIARAYEKLPDDAQALRWYRNYLRLSPQAENAKDVRQYTQQLSESLAKKGIQQLTVLSTPSGATVSIDGNPLGVTPLTVELRPGPHRALLSLRGYKDATNELQLPAAKPIDITVVLQPAPALAADGGAPADRGRRFGVAPWITLGVAAACLGGAAGFEVARRSAQNSAKNEQVQIDFENDVDAMNSRRTTARIFLAAGGALAVTGAALLLFNKRLTPESRAVVAGVPGGATLAWERSF